MKKLNLFLHSGTIVIIVTAVSALLFTITGNEIFRLIGSILKIIDLSGSGLLFHVLGVQHFIAIVCIAYSVFKLVLFFNN